MRRAKRPRSVPSHAATAASAMRPPPAPTARSRAKRRKSAKRRFRVTQTSTSLPSLLFPVLGSPTQFAAFAFDQELQFIQQLRVMRAERLHQIRERQGGSVARSQQLPDALERRDPLQLFGGVARRVAERPAFRD